MGFRNILTKGSSVAFASKSSQHSKKASSYAKQAMSSFQKAKYKKESNEKIDSLIEGMNQLSKSIIEISDSVPPIAQMTAINVLFGENLKKLLEEKKILK
ncbi:MAG: hypothetical protein ACJZ4A_00035 [Candidatus Pelagibacter sp.]